MASKIAARVAELEAGQTPTELVVRWLDEAHAFGGLEAYCDSLIDEDPRRFPLNRLLMEAVCGVETTTSRKGDDFARARRRALRETAFRYQLVMGINLTTHDLLIRQGLVHALIAAHLGLASSRPPAKGSRSRDHSDRYVQCCDLAFRLVSELLAAEAARESLQARFLAGHPALFPDDALAFDDLLHDAQRMAVMALRLAELDGVPVSDPTDPEAIAQRARLLEGDLLEPARSSALEKLGEDREAASVATCWLRSRRSAGAAGQVEGTTL